ncbi:MAG: DUF3310 domain-containing protein [Planctomycetota bacterium]|nr:DUF3310 domain-containing protein [Planctomycetota bacterium]
MKTTDDQLGLSGFLEEDLGRKLNFPLHVPADPRIKISDIPLIAEPLEEPASNTPAETSADKYTATPVVTDPTNPPHYTLLAIEPIDFIESCGFGEAFCAGNAIKYLARYKMKGGIEDVRKAEWYVKRLIRNLE